MVQGMGIASCSCGSFHSIDTWLFSSLIENHKLKNLLLKVGKVLAFLYLAFFNLEQMIHYVDIILKL